MCRVGSEVDLGEAPESGDDAFGVDGSEHDPDLARRQRLLGCLRVWVEVSFFLLFLVVC
jgi:hypothetical protein